ncbi:MAG TPA: AGE family epimerase/isomerase [Stellaceae bacterium]|nr:AGE family epimerase/isomerase [Stellaceae bacterium]
MKKRIEDFLEKGLFPLWAERGWDKEQGGFHERLLPDLRPAPIDYRRLTSCARQLFVFCEAARRTPRFRSTAEKAASYLKERFYDPSFQGFVFKLDLKGAVVDPRKDLYALSFVLFALAHYYETFDRKEVLGDALALNQLLRRHLLLPSGWYGSDGGADWTMTSRTLEQNPHMHLLEAQLAWFRVSGEDDFKNEATRLIDLFHRHLFDRRTGTLGEFFDDRGAPHPERGHIVEPGHHFEWVWLLHEAAALLGTSLEAADRLFEWAVRFGLDHEQGGVFDQLDREGRVLLDTKRIWPLTECIKARFARFRVNRRQSERDAALADLEFLFRHYLLEGGAWREHLRRDLTPSMTEMPATTPYHLLMCFLEALRALSSTR